MPGNFLLKSGLESNFSEFSNALSKVSSTYVFNFFDNFYLSIYALVTSVDKTSFDFILVTNSLSVKSIKLLITLLLSVPQNNLCCLLVSFLGYHLLVIR